MSRVKASASITRSSITRVQADDGGELNNQKLKDLCFDKNIVLSFSPAHEHAVFEWHCRENGWNAQDYSSATSEASSPGQDTMVICGEFAGHMTREKVLGRIWSWPLLGQLASIWRGQDKDEAKSLDDRGAVGYVLDITQTIGST